MGYSDDIGSYRKGSVRLSIKGSELMFWTKATMIAGAGAVAFMTLDSGHRAVQVLTEAPLIEGVGIAPAEVHAGDTVLVEWDIVKRTDCPGYSSRVWSGESGFQLTEPVQASGLPVGSATYEIQTGIPRLAPEGPLSLEIVGHYDCEGREPWHFRLGPVEMMVTE